MKKLLLLLPLLLLLGCDNPEPLNEKNKINDNMYQVSEDMWFLNSMSMEEFPKDWELLNKELSKRSLSIDKLIELDYLYFFIVVKPSWSGE